MRKRILLAAALLGLSSTVLAESKCGGFTTQYSAIDEICDFREGYAAISIGPGWGFIDRSGRLVIEPKFDEVGSFSQGLAPVALNDKWGFIDSTGALRIPATFDEVYGFADGLAEAWSGGKAGYIDQQGRWAIEPRFDNAGAFHHGVAVATLKYGHDILIDRTGRVIRDFGPGYRIARVRDSDRFVVIRSFDAFLFNIDGRRVPLTGALAGISDFHDGLAIQSAKVGDSDRYGAMDLKGQWVVQPIYETLEPFHAGLAIARRDDKYGLIDVRGRVVVDFNYVMLDRSDSGLYSARADDKSSAIFDRDGHLLYSAKCESFDLRHEGDWDYIGGCQEFVAMYRGGKPVRVAMPDAEATPVGDLIFIESDGEQKPFAVIGPKGIVLSSEDPDLKGQYDMIIAVAGRGAVHEAQPGLMPLALLVKDYEKIAVVTRDRRIVSRPEWKYDTDLLDYRFNRDEPLDGPLVIQTEDGTGAIDANGQWIVEPKFERLRMFRNGVAIGRKDDQILILDNAGHSTPLPDGFDFEGATGPHLYAITGEDAEGNAVRIVRNLKTGSAVTQAQSLDVSMRGFHAGLTAARKDERWGLMNAAGTWVLPAEYDEEPRPLTKPNDEFVGWVVVKEGGKDCDCELRGFVSPQGRIVLPVAAGREIATDSQGLLQISYTPAHSTGRHGLMTVDGREVLAVEYDDPRDYGDGWYQIKPADQYGVINAQGEWTVQLAAHDFEDLDQRDYAIDEAGDEPRLIHLDGLVSTPSKPLALPGEDGPAQWLRRHETVNDETMTVFYGFDWKERLRVAGKSYDDFSEGLLAIESNQRPGFPTALLTTQGKIIGPLPYHSIGAMHEGLATFSQSRASKNRHPDEEDDEERDRVVGYIDRNGKVVIAPKFQAGSDFHEERATVILNDNVAVIDTKGQILVRGAWRCESEPVLVDGKGKVIWPKDGKTQCVR